MEDLNYTFDRMTDEAMSSAALWAGRVEVKPRIDRYVDLRYKGQSSEISLLVSAGAMGKAELVALTEAFEAEHEKTYGHRLPGFSFAIQSLRLIATIPTRRPSLTRIGGGAGSATTREGTQSTRKAYWGKKHGIIDTTVLELEQVGPSPRQGPILVDCYDTTIVVPPGCTIAMGDWGNVIINIESREN